MNIIFNDIFKDLTKKELEEIYKDYFGSKELGLSNHSFKHAINKSRKEMNKRFW